MEQRPFWDPYSRSASRKFPCVLMTPDTRYPFQNIPSPLAAKCYVIQSILSHPISWKSSSLCYGAVTLRPSPHDTGQTHVFCQCVPAQIIHCGIMWIGRASPLLPEVYSSYPQWHLCRVSPRSDSKLQFCFMSCLFNKLTSNSGSVWLNDWIVVIYEVAVPVRVNKTQKTEIDRNASSGD
jgi:hypothetical protein